MNSRRYVLSTMVVAIPLGQGQVFNDAYNDDETIIDVAIPLGQGQVFNRQPQVTR